MCGIVAFSANKDKVFDPTKLSFLLYINSIRRGTDGTGYYTPDTGVVKDDDAALKFLVKKQIKEDNLFIGHVRAATVGIKNKYNTHPFHVDDTIGVHNGTLDNPWPFCEHFKVLHSSYQVDSHGLIAVIAKTRSFKCLEHAEGAAALVVTNTNKADAGKLFIYRHDRPLFYGFLPEGMYVSSDEEALTLLHCKDVKEFDEDVMYIAKDGKVTEKGKVVFGKAIVKKPIPLPASTGNTLGKHGLDNYEIAVKRIDTIVRLGKCVGNMYPAGMPFAVKSVNCQDGIIWFKGLAYDLFQKEGEEIHTITITSSKLDNNSFVVVGCYATTVYDLTDKETGKVVIPAYTLMYIKKLLSNKTTNDRWAEVYMPGGLKEIVVPYYHLVKLTTEEISKVEAKINDTLEVNSKLYNNVIGTLNKCTNPGLENIMMECMDWLSLEYAAPEDIVDTPALPEENDINVSESTELPSEGPEEAENAYQPLLYELEDADYNHLAVTLQEAYYEVEKMKSHIKQFQAFALRREYLKGCLDKIDNSIVTVLEMFESESDAKGAKDTVDADADETNAIIDTLDEKVQKQKDKQKELTPIETMSN